MKRIYFLTGPILILVLIIGCVQETKEATLEEYCTKLGTGEKIMSLSEAKEIAANSECVKEGALKENNFCNEDTGTWWIDLDIQKELCNPACVINVATKEAVINWRCTGAIPE